MRGLFEIKRKELLSDKYSHKVSTPQYLPKDAKPNISELMDTTKYAELMRDIEKADASEDEKKFLRLAATRHIIFRYDKIADYYAHSEKIIQELMEDSALVIIDFDDAILKGYVELSKDLKEVATRNNEK